MMESSEENDEEALLSEQVRQIIEERAKKIKMIV